MWSWATKWEGGLQVKFYLYRNRGRGGVLAMNSGEGGLKVKR